MSSPTPSVPTCPSSTAICQIRRPLADIGRTTFWTFTTLALPGCILSTAAYFASSPAFLAQLSPFRVQYAVLLAAHALFCLAIRRRRWAGFFAIFLVFNLWAVLRPGRQAPVANHPAPSLKILLANVLTSNADPAPLLALIYAEKPDLIALLEVNARWKGQLADPLRADYPHVFFKDREDNFGLAVFSRHRPDNGRVEFFADVETPSFDFTLTRGADKIRILLTHPLPPGDGDTTRLRDQHIADLVNWAKFVRELNPDAEPTLILGDFNATPWCPPLRRLLVSTQLRIAAREHTVLAPSWPIPIPFLRIPLDHALLNPLLVCTSYRVGPDIGSDHFPIILEVQPLIQETAADETLLAKKAKESPKAPAEIAKRF